MLSAWEAKASSADKKLRASRRKVDSHDLGMLALRTKGSAGGSEKLNGSTAVGAGCGNSARATPVALQPEPYTP